MEAVGSPAREHGDRAEALRRDLEAGRVRHVLLVRHGRLGENLFWTPIPRALRRARPGLRVSVLSNAPQAWSGHPEVEQVLEIPRGFRRRSPASRLAPVAAEIERIAPDAILVQREPEGLHEVLRGSGVTHLLDPEWMQDAPPPSKLPSAHNAGSTELYHSAEQAVLYAAPLGIADPPWPMEFHVGAEAREEARRRLRQLGVAEGARLVFYCVGTAQTSRLVARRLEKSWPIRNFIDCARALLAREDVVFYLSHHSRREHWMARAARRALPPGRVAMFERPVPLELVGALMLESRCVISCDTGPLHLASAVGAPTVALFGRRAPAERNGPYLLGGRGVVLYAMRDGERQACRELEGEAVAEAVQELLARPAGAARPGDG